MNRKPETFVKFVNFFFLGATRHYKPITPLIFCLTHNTSYKRHLMLITLKMRIDPNIFEKPVGSAVEIAPNKIQPSMSNLVTTPLHGKAN